MNLEDVRIFLTLTEREMLILRYAMSLAIFKSKESTKTARSRAEKYDFDQFTKLCEELGDKLTKTEHDTLRRYGLLKEN